MPSSKRLSEQCTVRREAKLGEQLCNFQKNISAKGFIVLYTRKPEGVYLFYNPPIKF